MSRQKKRFIAGATCPKCGAVDKIYVLESGDERSRHCTRCDFSEHLDADSSGQAPAGDWQPINIKPPDTGE